MKQLVRLTLAVALFTTPLFAANKATVTIPNDATIGTTKLAAGEYKLTYDGSGPVVKVTLTQSGHPPIQLDAKLEPTRYSEVSVSIEKKADGQFTLRSINVGRVALVFETAQPENQTQSSEQ